MPGETRGYYLVMSHLCCWIDTDEDGIITRTAPILRWSRFKHIEVVHEWATKKGGSLRRVI